MCGITGIFKLDGSEWDDKGARSLQSMLEKLRHRGPDSSGMFIEGAIALGVNRLSVVDPATRSDQPMRSGDGRFIVAFNGEIYNFRFLREQLVEDGFSFTTFSDTEVLLALYAQQGAACLNLLRGMFAFAIWDRHLQALFIARDRLGEKPFYYYKDDTFFAFASELPALLSLPEIPRKADWAGIHQAMNFMHAVAPKTPFRNIFKLQPAHYMVISTREIRLARYWQCSFDQKERFTDINECASEVERCLDDTVSLMCRCDVPVGALLSGGLDSSIVVASMYKHIMSFPTFRISSTEDLNREEFKSAQQVSQFFGTRHHEYEATPAALPLLEKIVRSHGEPISTAVCSDAFLLAKEMKTHVTVALCGAGSDELFGGYREHHILHMLDGCFGLWRSLERDGKDIDLSHQPEKKWAWKMFQEVGRTNPERVFASIKYNNQSIFNKIYSKKMQDIAAANDPVNLCIEEFHRCGTDSLFDGFIGQLLNCSSQYSTAEINDRAGMAYSVEIRSPFLDVNMVELALKIPPEFKVLAGSRNSSGKHVLRMAMQKRLPPLPLVCRKIGFGGTTPYKKWLTEDCAGYIEAKLQSDALADSGMFNMPGIQELFLLYQCGAKIDADLFIGLVSTAIWLETFL
jgi:asparagine synthase (glutamine-hydrolysing)